MREYNNLLRKKFTEVLETHGLKMKFVADKLGIEYTTLSKWKNGKLDFGEDKAKQVAYFLEKYEV
ncbi:helix-turn-helix domain-containing protein [Neobacillus sedimentimangrovi]|uniref:Helix-turn-helix domain-containing protein n=1 Tax=Neobacillus sedimentimangrovi TaxID=2699460 RepID=A0ABS8QL28_9BACI|nr:helix-turn-helix transcriptional regulator [Neobacillus sedimentimangrovi]MCD4839750.1 helix-turn-helix domain-containing protein [Neobacillus sedimentimangrovi]